MSATPSTMKTLGTAAPFFDLVACDGVRYTPDSFAGAPALLVVFMCNHCPYVKHVREKLVGLIDEYRARGVAVVGINSNDAESYPDDGPEQMREDAARYFYRFPYLIDATQETARAYGAACTPDFFLFDDKRNLAYRGQMDGSRPGNGLPVTGEDLRSALDAVLAKKPVSGVQRPSLGCNIKWKRGNEPEYYVRPL